MAEMFAPELPRFGAFEISFSRFQAKPEWSQSLLKAPFAQGQNICGVIL